MTGKIVRWIFDEFAIWDRSLTDEEAATFFNNGAGVEIR
tara:strand:- start:1365 stop:1481 length:117 start_codon:yes stop_codon:yes gene_type:complete